MQSHFAHIGQYNPVLRVARIRCGRLLKGDSLNVICNSVPIYVVHDVPCNLMPFDAIKPFPWLRYRHNRIAYRSQLYAHFVEHNDRLKVKSMRLNHPPQKQWAHLLRLCGHVRQFSRLQGVLFPFVHHLETIRI